MSAKAQQLFKYKSGVVEAVIIGPKEGYLWKRIQYYRFEFCSKRKEWVQLPPDRENDQPHLRACVNKVNKWLEEYAA